jgi:chromosome segregation ATPase
MVNPSSSWERELYRAKETIAGAERWPKLLRGLARNQGRLNHIFYHLLALVSQEVARSRAEREVLTQEMGELKARVAGLVSALEALELRVCAVEGELEKPGESQGRATAGLGTSSEAWGVELRELRAMLFLHKQALTSLEAQVRRLATHGEDGRFGLRRRKKPSDPARPPRGRTS